ncbi:MAG TPA: nucleotidyltransferase, partial [Pyrinomonadaceae bacterium]|nr:nucleotidyltransferase [Pyrinomonadaceae bacterium]
MARTLEQGFQDLLKRLIPLASERERGTVHKASVRSCLVKNFGCFSFFETGSFGNRTGVRHFSDTDYFAVCPDQELRKNSSKTLREVKEALQYTFWRTAGKIKVNSPSVTIPFGKYASENLEITPCFYNKIIATPLGRKKSYGIADGQGGWMLSSPQAHNAYVELHDRRLLRRLKPLITLVKAWKFFHNVPVSSFYLELRITKFAESKKKINYEIDLY